MTSSQQDPKQPAEAEQRDRELVVPLTADDYDCTGLVRMAGDLGRRNGAQA